MRLTNTYNTWRGPAIITRVEFPQGCGPTWPHVLAFAKQMEAKLAKNRHKGDREGWLKLSEGQLLDRIREEVYELENALGGFPESVVQECADIANFTMMLADKVTHEAERQS